MDKESTYEACEQATNRFFWYLDQQRYADMVAMMHPDATWLRQGKKLVGREAVLAALSDRSPTQLMRHVMTNGFVESATEDRAVYRAYMLGYRYDDGSPKKPPQTISGPVRMLLVETLFTRRGDGPWMIQDTSAIPEFEFANPTVA